MQRQFRNSRAMVAGCGRDCPYSAGQQSRQSSRIHSRVLIRDHAIRVFRADRVALSLRSHESMPMSVGIGARPLIWARDTVFPATHHHFPALKLGLERIAALMAKELDR